MYCFHFLAAFVVNGPLFGAHFTTSSDTTHHKIISSNLQPYHSICCILIPISFLSQSFAKFHHRHNIKLSLLLFEYFLSKKPNRKVIMDTGEHKYPPNPKDSAGIFSIVFYWWIVPLFRKGNNKTLEMSDMCQPPRVAQSKSVGHRLEQ